MNNFKRLIEKTPLDTYQVKQELVIWLGMSYQNLQDYINNPARDPKATTALLARDYFRQHFECEIDDVVEVPISALAKRQRLSKPTRKSKAA